MHNAQIGDRVRIQYARVLNSAASREDHRKKTCEFIVGGKGVFLAVSKGVVGMSPGERKQLTLQPGEAYGEVLPKLIRKIPRGRFPSQLELRVGKRLRATNATSGRHWLVTVVEIRRNSVVVNGNHPLAGQTVTFDVDLLSLDSSSTANLRQPQKDVGGEG